LPEAGGGIEGLARFSEESGRPLGTTQALGQPSRARPLLEPAVRLHGRVELARALQAVRGFHRGSGFRRSSVRGLVSGERGASRGVGLQARGIDEIPRFLQQFHGPAPLADGQEQFQRLANVSAPRKADGRLERDLALICVQAQQLAPVVLDAAQEHLAGLRGFAGSQIQPGTVVVRTGPHKRLGSGRRVAALFQRLRLFKPLFA